MNTKNLFLVNAIVCFLYGLPMIFDLSFFFDNYLAEPEAVSPGARFLGIAYGILLTAVGVGLLVARPAAMSYGRRAILVMIFLANLLISIAHVWAITSAIENSMGWTTVAVTSLLTVWSGMLLIKERAD